MKTEPKFTFSGRINTFARRTQEQVDSLRPAHSPGMLTSRTTRGVIRKPIPGVFQEGTAAESEPPRWQ